MGLEWAWGHTLGMKHGWKSLKYNIGKILENHEKILETPRSEWRLSGKIIELNGFFRKQFLISIWW